MDLKSLLLVFIGGGSGSMLRFWLGKSLNQSFPNGTLLVNVIGAFLMGLVLALFQKELVGNPFRLLVAVGFCGGFTTFSSFAFEKLQLLQSENYSGFMTYLLLSISLGLLFAYLGFKLGKTV